jgi:hypothetical protein
VLVTTNGYLGLPGGKAECSSFDSFVATVSYYSTWLSAIGFKKSLWDDMGAKDGAVGSNLIHMDWLLRMVDSTPSSLVVDEVLFDELPVAIKQGYNFFEVFVRNYLSLLSSHLGPGSLSRRTYRIEKQRLLHRFVFPWCLEMMVHRDIYRFGVEGATGILLLHYGPSLVPQLLVWAARKAAARGARSAGRALRRFRSAGGGTVQHDGGDAEPGGAL